MIKEVMRETNENKIGAWDLDDDMLIIGYRNLWGENNWYKLQYAPYLGAITNQKYFWANLRNSKQSLDVPTSFGKCIYHSAIEKIFVLSDISEMSDVYKRVFK